MGRVQQPGEPLWLPDDTELAMEWQEWQNLLCPGCGHPTDESMDTAAARDELYEARTARCHACAAMQDKVDGDAKSGVRPGGLRYRVTRR